MDTALINLIMGKVNDKDESAWNKKDMAAALDLFSELEASNPMNPMKRMTVALARQRFYQLVKNFSKTGIPINYEQKADEVTRAKFWRYLQKFGLVESDARFPIIDRNELKKQRIKKLARTDPGEVKILLGCLLTMGFNKVPKTRDYWANEPSLGNPGTKAAITRDRFLLLSSKLYFACPNKPSDASKT